jgi:hypothetical protein
MPTTRNLAILIFDEVAVLDLCWPVEGFRKGPRQATLSGRPIRVPFAGLLDWWPASEG